MLVALLAFARSRGGAVRALALALMVLALANPSFTREDREPLSSVAAVVVDKSPSQNFGDRTKQTEAARAALAERLGSIPGLEVRFVEAGEADGETDGTRLFAALGAALADVPPDRVAGAIMITDGRVHDVPAEAAALGFAAPVHALITGTPRRARPPRRAGDGAALRHRRPVADHRLSRRGPGRAAGARARSPSAATARCSSAAPSRPAAPSTRRSRSRMPGRTSSRSRPRRSKAS